jgi:hypothetical protein
MAKERLSRKNLGVIAGALVSVVTLLSSFASPASASPLRELPPAPTPAPAAAVPSGSSGVPAGISPGSPYMAQFVGLSAAGQAAQIALMKADGVRFLRIDVPCGNPYASLIAQAEQAGIQVDALLLAACGGQSASAYATYSAQVVKALKPLGVELYEVMNEPNCQGVSAASYTAILRSAYSALKKADPGAFVLAAGLCVNGGSYEPYTYLQAMYRAGAKGYFDAANDHPYTYPDTPLQTNEWWNPWAYLPQMHAIMANNGDGAKKIWLTEFGCPTGTDGGLPASCTPTTEGQQITDAFTKARGWTWTGPLLVFNWQDTSDGDFGLFTSSGVPKAPALAAFKAAAGV